MQKQKIKREKRTKIVCTMGPSVNTEEKIAQLIDAGMNIARLNFSHGTHEEHLKVIQMLKTARKEKRVSLAIMADTKGPEVRLGEVKNQGFSVTPNQRLSLVKAEISGDVHGVQLTPSIVVDKVKVGTTLLINDGCLMAWVAEKHPEHIVIVFENEGMITSHKGVNVPGIDLDLPAMTEKDRKDLSFVCEHDLDLVAASFIRSEHHVLEIKEFLKKRQKSDILVIAKIENGLGVQNFREILNVADGIMVARGDLGVEVPLTEVPALQKMMIGQCCHMAKPVITATQMLESMIKNPRPTRAEVSDVANAIYDGTSAVMLSGETAIGAYPIETVKMMSSVIEETEKHFRYREFFDRQAKADYHDVSHSVALASVKTAYSLAAAGIFCFTSSGLTARLLSQFRPEMPMLGLTAHEKTYHQLSLYWGIIAVGPQPANNAQEAFAIVSQFALENNFVRPGERVVITLGSPFGISGTTNMLLVESIP